MTLTKKNETEYEKRLYDLKYLFHSGHMSCNYNQLKKIKGIIKELETKIRWFDDIQ